MVALAVPGTAPSRHPRTDERVDAKGVISDIRCDFGLDFDPEQIAALRFHLDRCCLISTRWQPSSAADQLRTEINNGCYFDSTAKFIIHLFESQVAKLNETTARVRGTPDDIEDQVLAGQVRGQHAQLGGIRRLAVRLNHHFGPEHRMLQRLCRRSPEWLSEIDNAALQDVAEEFRELVDDLSATQERQVIAGRTGRTAGGANQQ